MQIEDSVVVITGAGSGIGKALAAAFTAAGASVVAGDIDAQAAAAAATEIGGKAIGVGADAATIDGVATLLEAARSTFGPVDIFVANAGIIGAPELGSDADWDRVLDVNLRAHVRAADALIPEWTARGSGHFVSVASAAGLLTQIGAAGYAVTKHAAVGFAEWLAITHGDDGIGVTVVCPMGVATPLLDAIVDSTDDTARVAAASITTAGEVLSADDVAAATLAGVRDGTFLVLPHPGVLDMYRGKGADYDRWIAGMRRYRRALHENAHTAG
ncbi:MULTISPECIES: SDR family oxidoreductase [Mycobacteriaceae]|uniref:Dehydrogenase n=1 Tax=Mycolicibacterium neoaurum VKM Ac-1815D TaxID=700508 RepID=V5X9A1_MYCNE|nr:MULTISPECIES: SDR family oxidoreductase [Mycobacteriaceae]AHC24552.1 dehydrogenase [Mycolicibacterium neoaurum VKM Ac-1815D]AMO05131.1 dehydrogenase [Mycolicibacterium neoaurum]AXK76561.1 SDR family oxidoreductase [Mycolicibacterium neoaurum]KJQ52221.1 dehydrogenase [Mycolicibacterium neoaurum]KUM07853.1 dehydrogenase [Mycolicibacterium neoaurum]